MHGVEILCYWCGWDDFGFVVDAFLWLCDQKLRQQGSIAFDVLDALSGQQTPQFIRHRSYGTEKSWAAPQGMASLLTIALGTIQLQLGLNDDGIRPCLFHDRWISQDHCYLLSISFYSKHLRLTIPASLPEIFYIYIWILFCSAILVCYPCSLSEATLFYRDTIEEMLWSD